MAFWGYKTIWLKNAQPYATCIMSFHEVGQSLRAYARDHDGKLPKAAEWQDEVRSYFKKYVEQHAKDMGPFAPMDANKPFGCDPMGNATVGSGIAFNSEVSEKKLSDVRAKDPRMVLIYEIDAPAPNANGPYKDRGWTGPEIMGTKREWLSLDVSGHMRGTNSRKSISSGNNPFGDDWSDDDSSSGKSASGSATSGETGAKKSAPAKTESPE